MHCFACLPKLFFWGGMQLHTGGANRLLRTLPGLLATYRQACFLPPGVLSTAAHTSAAAVLPPPHDKMCAMLKEAGFGSASTLDWGHPLNRWVMLHCAVR